MSKLSRACPGELCQNCPGHVRDNFDIAHRGVDNFDIAIEHDDDDADVDDDDHDDDI